MDEEPGTLGDDLRVVGSLALLGFCFGLVMATVVDVMNWPGLGFVCANAVAGGLGAIVLRGYRLRAVLAFGVTMLPCLALGHLVVGDRLPDPWRDFLPAAVAIALGSHVAAVAVHRRRLRRPVVS
ncbi:hypothetical protein ACIBF5_13110 [Micromonospora sp. NPDC050417]|uniref:hypothetical protein n=1 Tax=Micromonospora sp. NPDC050417 TaxID=3364280 RepID=UPI0037AD8D2A